jgi:S1-C subfamily serine protease
MPSSGLSGSERPEEYVVRIRRQGQVVGLGVVLGSGRILASLSSLGSGRGLTLAFSNGDHGTLRVLRSHRGFDLALLGVDAANVTRHGLELSVDGRRTRTLGFQGGRPHSAPFRGAPTDQVYGADSVSLDGAWLAQRPLMLGTPVVDDAGRLSGFAVLGCVSRDGAADEGSCRERDVVLPPALIDAFLNGADAADSVGWFGAGVELYDAGWLKALRVVSVEAGGPAHAANLLPTGAGTEGDLIVALDGVPIGTPWRLYETVMGLLPGTEVDLLLLRGGVFRHVSVRLGAQPRATNAWQLTPPLIQPPSPWFGY